MLELLKSGGVILWILCLISVVSLGLILERGVCFSKNKTFVSDGYIRELKKLLNEEKYDEAINFSEKEKGFIGKVITKFLKRYCKNEDFKNSDELIREIELKELDVLEKNIYLLGIIAYVSPMLGLLGTVTGMIQAFSKIAKVGTGDPTAIASGISQALLTTAGGLIIAIPALIAYNIFNKKIEKIETEIEKITTLIINIVKR